MLDDSPKLVSQRTGLCTPDAAPSAEGPYSLSYTRTFELPWFQLREVAQDLTAD